MIKLLWIIVTIFVVSSISFVGAVTLILAKKKILLQLVGFAAGAFAQNIQGFLRFTASVGAKMSEL